MSHNIVCASCGCLGHDIRRHSHVPASSSLLHLLAVDPSKVHFPFACGIPSIDDRHIMIDPLAICSEDGDIRITICKICKPDLQRGKLPSIALANSRWVGEVPPELQNLTWIEQAVRNGSEEEEAK
jgi:hypothetical protein